MVICGLNFEGPYKHTDKLKELPGIYVIACRTKTPTIKDAAVDVGQSENIKVRIATHDRKDCWKKNCGGEVLVYAHYMPGSSEEERTVVEKEIREQLSPPCGEQ